MRNAFVRALSEQMNSNKDTLLLTADLGWNSFDQIRERYPGQFINMGLTEQAMVGVSAGMSKMGKNVYVYSIIPFLFYRAFEQIRDDVCYPDLPVRFVGTGAGFAYGEAGSTHHPFEDLRVASALPNLVILNPSDPKEVSAFLEKVISIKHPLFLRLGRNGEPIIHKMHNSIKIGKALKLADGERVLIISTGAVTKIALDVSKLLNIHNEVVEVLEIHTFKPFDEETVRNEADGKDLVITIEDNNGALEEKVAKALFGARIRTKFLSFKAPDQFTHISATTEYLLESYGISAKNIVKHVNQEI